MLKEDDRNDHWGKHMLDDEDQCYNKILKQLKSNIQTYASIWVRESKRKEITIESFHLLLNTVLKIRRETALEFEIDNDLLIESEKYLKSSLSKRFNKEVDGFISDLENFINKSPQKFSLKNFKRVIKRKIDSHINKLEFISKNPENLILEDFLKDSIEEVKSIAHLVDYCSGYDKISMTEIIDQTEEFKLSSIIGYDFNMIKKECEKHGFFYLCYFAVPMDSNDFIKNEPYLKKLSGGLLEDWDLEKIISKVIKTKVARVGSFKHKDHERWGKFNFILFGLPEID